MTLPEFDPVDGLWGLAIYSFLAATILPGSSEIALYAMLRHLPELHWPALIASTIGNTLGGLFTWGCGRFLPRWQRQSALPGHTQLKRWGSCLLVLSWVPLIGDALCLAAGWLRLHWLPCALFMALGKFARYLLVAHAAGTI